MDAAATTAADELLATLAGVHTAGSSLVDVDDPSTWPDAVTRWVDERAANVEAQVTTTQDLGMRFVDQEDEFRRLFMSQRLLAYHSTRLLHHEAAEIRRNGMRVLTAGLVDNRIERAWASGAIEKARADHLRRNSVFALHEDGNRAGKICFSLGRSVFEEDPGGVAWLLSLWGGEAIYWAHADEADPPRIGTPSVVVAAIDVNATIKSHFFPSLPNLFIGRLLGIPGRFGEVHYYASVDAEHIVDLWQPGDPDYDRHGDLVRA